MAAARRSDQVEIQFLWDGEPGDTTRVAGRFDDGGMRAFWPPPPPPPSPPPPPCPPESWWSWTNSCGPRFGCELPPSSNHHPGLKSAGRGSCKLRLRCREPRAIAPTRMATMAATPTTRMTINVFMSARFRHYARRRGESKAVRRAGQADNISQPVPLHRVQRSCSALQCPFPPQTMPGRFGVWSGIFLFRGNILRRRLESRAQQPNFRRCEVDARRPLPSPSAGAGIEHAWRFLQKVPLLLWRELHHPMLVVGITERGKNPAADPEIRMIHVRRLNRSGNLESQTAKFICGHGINQMNVISSLDQTTGPPLRAGHGTPFGKTASPLHSEWGRLRNTRGTFRPCQRP